MKQLRIAISACLSGKNCRYDGRNCLNTKIIEIIKDQKIIPICPETAGGLPTPREPSEISKDKVISISGKDVSENYRQGALKELEKVLDCDLIILKQKSPACGKGKIYDGSFSGRLIEGNGIFTQFALNKNIPIFSEDEDEKITEFIASKMMTR